MSTQDYPKMLYASDGSTMIVPDEAAEQSAGAGWSTTPTEVHRAQNAVIQPLPSGQEPFVEAVAQRTAALVLEALAKSEPPAVEEPPPPAPAKRGAKAASPEMPTESGE